MTRLRATLTFEYEADPDLYANQPSAAMATIDEENLRISPLDFVEACIDEGFEARVEVVE